VYITDLCWNPISLLPFSSTYLIFEVLRAVGIQSNVMQYNSPLGVNRRFGINKSPTPSRTNIDEENIGGKVGLCLPLLSQFVSWSSYSSTLKMDAICSSETSVNFQRTARDYIPEEDILHSCCYISFCCSDVDNIQLDCSIPWGYRICGFVK
jgi:hypothetical protein